MSTTIQQSIPMPMPGAASAPKTFEGKEADIEDFLEDFVHCADLAHLSSEDRVSYFFRYLGRRQKDFFRGLDGYSTKDWDTNTSC